MNGNRGNWQRVSRRRPCPVCGKPDWCLYKGPADAPEAVVCARIETSKRCGEAGWLHRLRDDNNGRPQRRSVRTVPLKSTERPVVDFAAFARQCHLSAIPAALRQLGDDLGVSVASLGRLGVGWSSRHSAWSFPMRDAGGKVRGIRLRLSDGRKLSVRGGRQALFVPKGLNTDGRLLIAEGPTDTAALLDLGFDAVGRPNCSGGLCLLIEAIQRWRPSEVVVVADGDGPGQRGAANLAHQAVVYCGVVKVVTPPVGAKDARAWKAAGATPADVLGEAAGESFAAGFDDAIDFSLNAERFRLGQTERQ